MKNNKYKGIPSIGQGVQVGYFPPSSRDTRSKTKYNCMFYNSHTKKCSALKDIECVGVSHSWCKYQEGEPEGEVIEGSIPCEVVNNGTIVTLKEIHTGEEIKIKVNSHKNPEHLKLLGKKIKQPDNLVENWEGHTYIVWEVKRI